MTAKEQKERDRLHRKWATQPSKMSWRELDRCRQLDRCAMNASRPERRDAPTIDRRYEGMLENQRQALVDETKRLQAQLDAESDIQHAQRQEIAALGLVNKELADALEAMVFAVPSPQQVGTQALKKAEAALRAAGRLS